MAPACRSGRTIQPRNDVTAGVSPELGGAGRESGTHPKRPGEKPDQRNETSLERYHHRHPRRRRPRAEDPDGRRRRPRLVPPRLPPWLPPLVQPWLPPKLPPVGQVTPTSPTRTTAARRSHVGRAVRSFFVSVRPLRRCLRLIPGGAATAVASGNSPRTALRRGRERSRIFPGQSAGTSSSWRRGTPCRRRPRRAGRPAGWSGTDSPTRAGRGTGPSRHGAAPAGVSRPTPSPRRPRPPPRGRATLSSASTSGACLRSGFVERAGGLR
jgi:hypothetical protein